MSKAEDRESVRRIIAGGFVLPAEIEEFFTKVKARTVSEVKRLRAEGAKEMAEFNKNEKALFAELPEEEKIVRDIKWDGTSYVRPLKHYEWVTSKRANIARRIPYFGRTDEDAVRLAEEDVDFKRIRFILRTFEITGSEITGARVYIDSASGDVNGTITGTKGTAHVQTIGAGGYNIQCFHFRCLVRKDK